MRASDRHLMIRLSLGYLALFAAACAWLNALASTGDPAATPAWALTWLIPWLPIVIPALTMTKSLIVRKQTSATGFWHQWYGAGLLTVFGAAIGAALDFIAQGNFTREAIIAAAGGAIASLGAAMKPTGKPSSGSSSSALSSSTPPPPPSAGSTAAAILWPIAVIGLAVPHWDCATLTPAQRAFGTAYGQCMEQRGLAVVPSVGQEAFQDLGSGASAQVIENQLVGLAGKAGSDAIDCAVEVWMHPATPAALPESGLVAARWWKATKGNGTPGVMPSTEVVPKG